MPDRFEALHDLFPDGFVMDEVIRRGRQRRDQNCRFVLDEHLPQHQFATVPLPCVIEQRGGMPMQGEVPMLDQLEIGKLLFGALQLRGDVVKKRRIALSGVATDDETCFLGLANGGQLENVDALVLPGIGDFQACFLKAINVHVDSHFPYERN